MKYTHISHGDGLNQRRHQIHHDDKSHREATETTELIQEHQFSQVVDRRVDPTTSLRKQNLPVIRCDSKRVSISDELRLVQWEVFQKKRRQVTILSEVQ